METFLPYYEEIKLAGHASCAYAGGLLGALAMFVGRYFAEARFKIDTILAFSFLASGALWILPFFEVVPQKYAECLSLGILVLCLFAVKLVSRLDWKRAFILWVAYFIAQTILFLMLYYNILR